MTRLGAPDLLRGLRRHWVLVLALTVLGGALGALGTLLVPDTYVSQAQVQVVHDGLLDVLEDEPGDTYETVDEANRRMASAALAALSDDVVQAAADASGLSPQEVRDSVTVRPLAGADVLVVEGSAGDPDTAARLARATTTAFLDVTRDAGREQLRDGAESLEGEAAGLLAASPDPDPASLTGFTDQLYARALELRTRASLYAGLGELIEQAQEPTVSAAPGPVRGTEYGVAGGLLAGVAIALLLSMRPPGRPAPAGPPAERELAARS